MSNNAAPDSRIHIIDAFRGFALAGVVLVHMVEQYLGAPPSEAIMSGMMQGPLDHVVTAFLEIFVRGKFFALFSFLFGLSFFIQMDRAAQRGIRFQGRFLWRIALLFAIGYVHSLFYRGDILTIYAVLGLFLVPFYRFRTAVILTVAALLILGTGRYAIFALAGGETIFPYGDFSPDLPHSQAYYSALLSGSLLDVFSSNAWMGHMSKMEFQLTVSGRWFLTFAYFLLGLWAGRARLFEKLDAWHKTIKKTMWAGLGACVLLIVSTIMLFSPLTDGSGPPELDSWHAMFAMSSYDLFNSALAVVILCAFVLIYRRAGGERVLGKMAPYGRMALTNYVTQTLIGTFILHNWGLGYLGKLSNAEMFGIAFVVLGLQIFFSTLWLRHFLYGPIEWLWRSGTWLKWQPLGRQAATA